MMKMASEMMKNMSADDFARMSAMAGAGGPGAPGAGETVAPLRPRPGVWVAPSHAAGSCPSKAMSLVPSTSYLCGLLTGHLRMTGAAGGAPALSPDMMAQLSSPETIAMVQRMMADMPAEDMAATMRQAGLDVTPEQAQQMQTQVRDRTADNKIIPLAAVVDDTRCPCEQTNAIQKPQLYESEKCRQPRIQAQSQSPPYPLDKLAACACR